jgi:hypothetical protein
VSAIVLQIAMIAIFFHYEMITNYSNTINLSSVVVFGMFLIIDIMLDIWLWIIVPKVSKNSNALTK